MELDLLLSLSSLQTQLLQIIIQNLAFPGDIHNRGLHSSLTLRPCLLKTRPIQNELKKVLVNTFVNLTAFMVTFLGFSKWEQKIKFIVGEKVQCGCLSVIFTVCIVQSLEKREKISSSR